MASGAILILATVPTHHEATTIAEALIMEELAACVQLSPIESWYRWEGKIEHAPETRLHIKTMGHLADHVAQRVRALHSYDIPEVIVIPIEDGDAGYLAWIGASVRSETG